MVTSIQLGNFFSSGGKTVLGGVAGSGLDTENLIKSLTEAKALPKTKLEDKIKSNDGTRSALTEFQTLLSKFQDASNFLRTPPGVGNDAANAFKYTTSNVTTNTGVDASNYLTATTSPGATLQSYTIDSITSVAKAKRQGTADITIATADTAFVTAAATANRFKAGAITLSGQTITLAENDTLNQVAAKFNAVSTQTGMTANVVKVNTGIFQLTFTATQTGSAADFNLNTVVDTNGVFNSFVFANLQTASNAVFKLDGVTITRQNNNVNDVINGVTLNILQATPLDTSLTAAVKTDTQIVKNAVTNFVNAYNDLRVFATKQTEIGSNGSYKDTAVLASNTVFRNTVSNISSSVTKVVSGLAANKPDRLASVGINFTDLPESKDTPFTRNIIDVDEGKLTSSIESDFEAFKRVFDFNLTSDNPNVKVFARASNLTVNSFSVIVGSSVAPALPTVTARYNNGSGNVDVAMDAVAIKDNTTGTVIGYTLKGKDGTVFAGLQLIYGATAATTMNLGITQGIADQVYNVTDQTIKKNTGTLATELNSLKTSDERLNEEITRISDQVEKYRQTLLDKFANLESALSKVNSLLQSLDADANARNKA